MNTTDLMLSPFHRFLRLEVLRAENGQAEIRLPFREEFLRQDGSDWLHGGIVSALVDIAGNCALYSLLGQAPPTIDMRVDYLRPARRELIAASRVVRTGRTIGICDVEVRDAEGKTVAVGRAVYAIPKPTEGK